MNIVLIGYRGCGKTTVGKMVAKKIGWKYISIDAEIIKKSKKTIPRIVKEYGWEKFRDIESSIALKTALKNELVIDTGGGIILRKRNVSALKRNGKLFWLCADIKTIKQRLRDKTDRPALLAGKSFLQEISSVLKKRTPIYKKVSDFKIMNGKKTPARVADEIISIFLKKDPKIKN